MPRPRTAIPSYRLHKQSGQAVVTLTSPDGRRQDVLLGKYDTPGSRAEYARVLAEWETAGRRLALPAGDLTVAELILAYWEQHCQDYYRKPDGRPTNRLHLIKMALRPLKELYGPTPARGFGPLALKAVRQKMIALGWSRGVINDFVGIVKQLFKWATENEMVPLSLFHGLQAVRGLRRGRSEARETRPVQPVPEALIEAALPFMAPQVRAMVRLQLLTAMRPGEVCLMRGTDLETRGRVWVYRPESHKTEHLGRPREIYLGPKAQEVLRPFLKTDLQAYLFSPWEAREWRFQKMRRRRKTKVQPSQVNRRRPRPKTLPRAHYDTPSYRRAIAYACRAADKQAHKDRPDVPAEEVLVPKWHPHQLRHNAATNLRREFGVELARIILGHATAFTTETYAEADRQQAMEVIGRVG
jgi:integrase